MRRLLSVLPAVALIGAVPTTDEPAPEPEWRIAQVRGIEVDGEISSMSPDGDWLAGTGPEGTLCLWEVLTLTPTCDDTELPISRQTPMPTMAWAPDSSAVAFDLNALVFGVDSDIYVYDVADAELANLTEDGYEGSALDAPTATPIDIAPTWSPDGNQLAFVRSPVGDDDSRSTTIMRVDRDGGDPVLIHRLDVAAPFAVWTPMYWLADGTIIYAQTAADLDEPSNGIWRLRLDGSLPSRLKLDNAEEMPGAAIAAAGGDNLSLVSLGSTRASRRSNVDAVLDRRAGWIDASHSQRRPEHRRRCATGRHQRRRTGRGVHARLAGHASWAVSER